MSSPQVPPAASPVPIAPVVPAFNPLDPASITWYVTAIVAVLGFLLKKDLTSYAGPVSMGLFAAVGIALGVIRAIQHRTYSVALQQYNSLRLDHYATTRNGAQVAKELVDKHVQDMHVPVRPPSKRTPAKKTTR